jgi:hypothetical protein
MKDLVKLIAATAVILIAGIFMVSEDPSKSDYIPAAPKSQEFDAYWYSGKAEISTYKLSMARYGDMHPGKSILVFVTEEFLIDAQVKKEHAGDSKSTSVLKLNKIDRFTTGIYDYSIMLSTFCPVDRVNYPYALKTTFSAQDWCGQSFMQLNRRGESYQALERSYFESEGDKMTVLEDAVLEDELWTQIRLEPKNLPVGKFEIYPSTQHVRLRHEALKAETVTGSLNLEVQDDSSERFIYSLKYESGRELKIRIQTVFPYRIFGWEEKVKSGFGADAKWLTTTARLDKTIKSSYWGENDPEDSELRKGLGLD